MAVSNDRIIAAVVKNEVTYGTPPGFNQNTDSILLYDEANPVADDTALIDVVPIRPSLTQRKSIIGRQLSRFTGVTYLQGYEDFATNKPWRFGPLLRAAGLSQTVNAGSSIVYAPRSSGFESVAIDLYLDGYKHLITGAYATFTMEATAGQACRVSWDVQGLYTAPTIAAVPSQTLETFNPPTFKSANAMIAGQTVVLKSFRFTAGVQISERLDANAATGLRALRVTGRDPRLEMVVEVDTALRNYFSDRDAATTHWVTFRIGTTQGNRIVFDFPAAQLLQLPYASDNNVRVFNLSYKVQSATDDEEYTLTWN